MVTIQLEYVKCGKKNCHCFKGLGHGPYYYAYWKKFGKLHKKYLGLINPYEGKTITPQLLQELEREQYIEEILEEKTPFEEFQEKMIEFVDITNLQEATFGLVNLVIRLGRRIEVSSGDDAHSFTNNSEQWAEIAVNQAGTTISTAYFKKTPTPSQLHLISQLENVLDTEIKIIIL